MQSFSIRLMKVLGLVAVACVVSNAQAQEHKMSSLEKQTQVSVAGAASFNSNNDLVWTVDTMGLNYIMPHFGVGGLLYLNGGNRQNLVYAVGPAVEYFVPVADNQHIFGQASVTIAGAERSDSNFGLGASLGYRYFLMQDVAISAKINRNWAKATDAGSKVQAVDATNLLIGFSVFF